MTAVGPYQIAEKLGHGGMSTVWRARDAGGRNVAVKVVSADVDAEVLRLEIATIATLSHRSIVRVLKWGDLPADAAAVLGAESGAPWFAMELGDLGCVGPHDIANWAQLRAFGLSVLEALMYAHARGVIHRDIKPENVLQVSREPRYVLTDFGIAFRRSRHRNSTDEVRFAAAGTLNYIAPEQLLGHWRDFAPYTDLFSLGAVMFHLATGRVAFTGASRVAIAMAHTKGAPALGDTRFEVPVGFSDWLQQMIATEPRERFAFAADAAYALLQLPGRVQGGTREVQGFRDRFQLTTIPVTWSEPGTQLGHAVAGKLGSSLHLGGARAPAARTWRGGSDTQPQAVGLALYSHGRVGVVGRDAERDALWSQLLAAIDTQSTRVAVIRGRGGLGATTLETWICERATELATADHIVVRRRGGTSGVADTLRHTLGLNGLAAVERHRRLRDMFGDVDIELLDLVATAIPMPMADEAFAVEQVLRQVATQRPLVVSLGDVQESMALLELILRLLDAPIPILVVLTVNEDHLHEFPHERQILAELLASEHTLEIDLRPLSGEATTQLIDAIEELEPVERNVVCKRALGNPLRVWNLLEVRASTSQISDGSISDLWRARLQAQVPPTDYPAVLAAAVLGDAVDPRPLRRLCAAAGFDVPPSLIERMLVARLWMVDRDGYRFHHTSTREHMLAEADPSTVANLHRLAAGLYKVDLQAAAALRGQHLVHAGEFEAGSRAIVSAIRALRVNRRTNEAGSLASWLRAQFQRYDVPADHPATLYLRLCEAHALAANFPDAEARSVALRVADDAERMDLFDVAAEAVSIAAEADVAEGAMDQGVTNALRAIALARRATDPFILERAAIRLGWCRLRRGELEQGEGAFREAVEATESTHRSSALEGLAYIRMAGDDYEPAARLLDEAESVARSAHTRLQLGRILNAKGDLHLRTGQFSLAKQSFSEATQLLQRSEPRACATVRVNLAAALVGLREVDEAMQVLGSEPHDQGPDPWYAEYTVLVRCVIAALRDERALWEREFSPQRFRKHAGIEFVRLWESAAEAWRAHGHSDLARQAEQVREYAGLPP